MKAKSNILLAVICLTMLAFVGCSSIMDRFTPAEIPTRAAIYAFNDPNVAGLTSLHKAKEFRTDIRIMHRDTQLDLKRLAQDDKNHYSDAIEVIDTNITESQTLQNTVLYGDGVTPGLMALMTGTGGLLVGRNFMKRPGDYSPDEVSSDDKDDMPTPTNTTTS